MNPQTNYINTLTSSPSATSAKTAYISSLATPKTATNADGTFNSDITGTAVTPTTPGTLPTNPSALGGTTGTTTTTPTTDTSTTDPNSARTAYLQYLNGLTQNVTKLSSPTDAETALQTKLNNENAQSAQAQQNLSGAGGGATTAFVQNAASKIAKNTALQTTADATQLKTLQDNQAQQLTAAQDAVKNGQLIQIGNDYIDPTTGQTVYSTPSTAGNFSLAQGATEYDANGNVIASSAPKDTYQVIKGATTTDALGNQTVAPDRTFDTTTGQYVNSDGSPITSSNGTSSGLSSTPQSLSGNTANTSSTGFSKDTFSQLGTLANTDFNPKSQVDTLAQNYIDLLLKNGTEPVASSLGRSITQAGLAQIKARATDLYNQATGTSLSGVNPTIIKGYQTIVNNNNKLLNNLGIQEGTLTNNFQLALDNLNKNDLNGAIPLINGLVTGYRNALGDPAAAQALSQNSTLSQELGNLLAVKNASGTTVYDKISGEQLLPANASTAQKIQVYKTILQEAKNSADNIISQNNNAYAQIDPLKQDQNNPLTKSAFMQSALTRSGINAVDAINQAKAQGQIAVIDNKTGKVGSIPRGEMDNSLYTIISTQ